LLQRCTYENTKKVLNNEDALSYYLLGAFITDGNLIQDKSRTNSFKISLCSKDIDWLELIQKELGGDGNIRDTCNNSSTLFLYGKDIYNWFVEHKCCPKKSLTQELPDIPDIHFNDFLKGCIDGDGSIYRSQYKAHNNKTYEQTTVYLCGASENFLLTISDKLNDINFKHSVIQQKPKNKVINGRVVYSKHNMYKIQFSGHKKCVKFLHWLYSSDTISMPRKKLIAESILQDYSKYLAED